MASSEDCVGDIIKDHNASKFDQIVSLLANADRSLLRQVEIYCNEQNKLITIQNIEKDIGIVVKYHSKEMYGTECETACFTIIDGDKSVKVSYELGKWVHNIYIGGKTIEIERSFQHPGSAPLVEIFLEYFPEHGAVIAENFFSFI